MLVREFIRNLLSAFFMMLLFAAIAWIIGLTSAGVLCGHWPENDDHPTNWDDTVLHPDAQ